MIPKDLKQLTDTFGTPLYIFDLKALRSRVIDLRKQLPAGVGLCFAIKVNPFILNTLQPLIDRFEICSPGEYQICQKLSLPEEKLVISGVYKSSEDMIRTLRTNAMPGHYTIESPHQFELLSNLAKKTHRTLNVLLRLSSGNQFGMDESTLRSLIANRHHAPALTIQGIQYYSGTQKISLKHIAREINHLDTLLLSLKDSGFTVHELEYGPGLPVYYFQDQNFNECQFLIEFSTLLKNMKSKPKITLEVGRSLSASCGTYCTKVVDIKRNHNQNYAILDGGMHHLTYFGQSLAMKRPYFQQIPGRASDTIEKWHLCGALCTANDILIKQLPLSGIAIGDIFAFENTGAYCMTEGMSLFLSRPLPRVVLCDRETTTLVRDIYPTAPLNTPII